MQTQDTGKDIPTAERLILALDVAGADEAKRLVELLGGRVRFYKLGLELFMAGGYHELVDWLLARGKKVFVDLKFFDVPQTLGRAVAQLKDRGISFATVHGNDAMLEAAVAAADDRRGGLGILAVTVLTSLDRADLDSLGFDCDLETLVLSRARRALQLGCRGVISSGLEASRLKAELGRALLIVSPGIRPLDNRPQDDQKRVATVEQAFANGADHIVVGRPIHKAPNPKAAAEKIQRQIAAIFAHQAA